MSCVDKVFENILFLLIYLTFSGTMMVSYEDITISVTQE